MARPGRSKRTGDRRGSSGSARGASSQRELAAAHGVALRAVQKWIADWRWVEAGFSVRGPWGAAEIERQRMWRGQLRENPAAKRETRNAKRETGGGQGDGAAGGGGAAPAGAGGKGFQGMDAVTLGKLKSGIQIQKLQEQVARLKMDNAVMRKEFVPREQVEEESAMKMRAIKTALMQIPKALRQLLADSNDPLVCEQLVDGAWRAMLADFEKGGVA